MAIRIVFGADEARRTILRRAPMYRVEATPETLAENARIWGEPLSIEAVVRRVIDDVSARGDAALADISRRLDPSWRSTIEVSRAEVDRARASVPRDLIASLEFAAARVRAFHERHVPRSWIDIGPDGANGQIVTPIERVGLLAPGGRAAYPSTVIMLAVPARVAGCDEIILCSPPGADGQPSAVVLAASRIAGVDRVFAFGGAQAVAALAFGTDSVPKVDKIFGPGNAYVAEAKRQLFGVVGIDQIAGPTETLIIADAFADPDSVAADALAQAEHDPMASAIVIAIGRNVATAIAQAIERGLIGFERAAIARVSLERRGGVIAVDDLATAIDLANEYAPEHLALIVVDPWSVLGRIRNAGGVFLGDSSLEALGDYVVGPSHVMPTGGTARFSSPTTSADFVKVTSLFGVNEAGLRTLGPTAARLARAEGLGGHAAAVEIRLKERTRV
ncbi:MAG: histidinol dehydrogenase [Chloroflexota bacterium]|nr:MAG: histidinol dehydrogenase [Chloroflexota bacterium]